MSRSETVWLLEESAASVTVKLIFRVVKSSVTRM